VIIIPAAGQGRRFREAGYTAPKHEIPLLGDPMIDWVIENVRPLDPAGEVFVATQERVGKTKGAMETIHRALVQAKPRPDERLVIANCDQLLDLSALSQTASIGNGLIFTFKSANPAHSYVECHGHYRITSIVEKPPYPPSDRAVSGVYVFANPHGIATAIKDSLAGAGRSASAENLQGEQYRSVAIRRMIDQGYALYAHDVPTAILGTPEDFQRFQTAAHVLRSMERR
jgi:dTDP-glucose pyrophosphorylase